MQPEEVRDDTALRRALAASVKLDPRELPCEVDLALLPGGLSGYCKNLGLFRAGPHGIVCCKQHLDLIYRSSPW